MLRSYAKYILILVVMAWALPSKGQQLPLFSQYMFHDIALNPATAGNKKYWTAKAFNRNQWMGIDGAPVTQVISAQGPMKFLPMGLGGALYNDMLGPVRQTGLNLVYSYKIPLTRRANLAAGIMGGLFQYQYDADKLTTHEPDDAAVLKAREAGMFVPDAGFGLFLSNHRYFIGISTNHLFEFQLKLGELERATVGTLARHYYLNAGYNITFKHAKQFEIEPSVLVKYVVNAPSSVDGTLKFYYNDMFWAGATYRSEDAIVFLAGSRIGEKLYFGYGYDMTTSALQNYSDGSHEIMLGMDLFKSSGPKLTREEKLDALEDASNAKARSKKNKQKAKDQQKRRKAKAKEKDKKKSKPKRR